VIGGEEEEEEEEDVVCNYIANNTDVNKAARGKGAISNAFV
jgi:hypothetical protein